MSTAIEFAINSIKASDEDEAALKKYQERATLINSNMRNAYMAGGMTDGFENNDNSAGTGFMGMGFAQMGMGMMQGMNVPQQNYQQAPQHNTFGTTTQSQAGGNSWKCNCGHVNTGNFCMECGSKKPLPSSANGWTCSCGTVNQGKFCMNCGAKKPAAAPLYRCDKCGWRPADPAKPPKFCPECDNNTMATECCYCGNPTMIASRFDSIKGLKPDYNALNHENATSIFFL